MYEPSPHDVAEALVRRAVDRWVPGRPLAEAIRADVSAIHDRSPAALEQSVDDLAVAAAEQLFGRGWTPIDLHETALRHADAPQTDFLRHVAAAATAVHPVQRVDSRWLSELAAIDAAVWWDRRQPVFGQWARRCGHEVLTAVEIAVAGIALMCRLRALEPVLPPPGAASTSAAEPDAVEARMLAKVRALLAKAEATPYDEEAEALSAKAQALMSRYAIDQAMLARPMVDDRASVRRMWLAAPYVRAKAMLVSAVAEANRCRTVAAERDGYVTIIGDAADLRLVTLLATSLLVQATHSLAGAGSRSSRTRSFRQSFLVAYATRIGERLRDTAHTAAADADRARWLPVLAARSRAAEELMNEYFPNLISRDVAVRDGSGWAAGRASADLARLDTAAPLDRDGTTRDRAG